MDFLHIHLLARSVAAPSAPLPTFAARVQGLCRAGRAQPHAWRPPVTFAARVALLLPRACRGFALWVAPCRAGGGALPRGWWCLPVSAWWCKGGGCGVRRSVGGCWGVVVLPARCGPRPASGRVGQRSAVGRSRRATPHGGAVDAVAHEQTIGRLGWAAGAYRVLPWNWLWSGGSFRELGAGRAGQAYLGPRIGQGVLVIRRHDDRLVGPARRGKRPLSLCRPSRAGPRGGPGRGRQHHGRSWPRAHR